MSSSIGEITNGKRPPGMYIPESLKKLAMKKKVYLLATAFRAE